MGGRIVQALTIQNTSSTIDNIVKACYNNTHISERSGNMSMTKKSMLSNMLQFLRMLLKDCLTRVENLRFWRPIRLRSERIILHSKNRLLRHTTKLKLPRKHCGSMQKRSDLIFATFGWLFHAGVIGVLTDKFIGVKMCFRAHFFVQNRCKIAY